VGYFEQALGAIQRLPETRDTREQAVDLRFALRSALLPRGDSGRVLACLHEAEALAAALDDPRRLGQAAVFLTVHFYLRGVYDQAIAAGQRALALATAGGHAGLQAVANGYLGRTYESRGDYRRAIDYMRQTVASIDGAQHHERFGQVILPAVSSRAWLAVCHAELGLFAEGALLGEDGLRIAEVVAHPGSLMYALWGLGLLALRHGDLPRALPRLERAMAICHEVDLPVYFPWLAPALGTGYILAGHVAAAVPLFTQALAQATAMEMAYFTTLCHLCLGEAHLRAGRLEEALALAEEALALARGQQERGHQAYALRLLGDIASHRTPPDVDQAAAFYQLALALTEELGMRPLQAHCYRGLGTLYATTGQWEQARAELSTAIEMYRSMEMTFWLPQTDAVLAQVEGR
jgi:tetratricopeptide (TPR) repeat protein